MAYDGPALFSVYSGVPPYLLAAAAMESRAFPAFAYDPAAGPDWASRFQVGDNPQAERDWPVHEFAYEDGDLQRATQSVAFTPIDFAACDARFARHRIPVDRADWDEAMIPASERLTPGTGAESDGVPYVWMIDDGNVLRRVVLDDTLIRVGLRVGQTWRSLQELGGINNSHARQLLERERASWEQEKELELAELRKRPAPEPAGPPAAEPDAPAAAPEAAPEAEPAEPEAVKSDDPDIETLRCTTCHECIQISSRMFAYDDNMQAYIADADAGTYRQMVEAAESCQVSIIRPGKPRNPDEPNLDELIQRAEPFS
jgi:ferredoxin